MSAKSVADNERSGNGEQSALLSDDSQSHHSEEESENPGLLKSTEQSAKESSNRLSRSMNHSAHMTNGRPQRSRNASTYGACCDTSFITTGQMGQDPGEGSGSEEQPAQTTSNGISRSKKKVAQRIGTSLCRRDDQSTESLVAAGGQSGSVEDANGNRARNNCPSFRSQWSMKHMSIVWAFLLSVILLGLGFVTEIATEFGLIIAYYCCKVTYDLILLLVTGYAVKVVFSEFEMEKVKIALRIT